MPKKPFPALFSFLPATVLVAGAFLQAGGASRTAHLTGAEIDRAAGSPRLGEALDLIVTGPSKSPLRAATGGVQFAGEPEEELATDDGSPDGIGILADGLMLVNRLTPSAYPVRVLRVRLYFVGFRNQPNPVGQEVRLIVFIDPEGKGRPPERPQFLVDERVRIPSTGGFVDFNVSGIRLEGGDLYVGYQAPRPHDGVGFATDTSSPPQQRGFFSEDGGATFGGPVEFADGQRFNLLMRAVVQREAPDAGDAVEELRVDDGTIEAGLLRDGAIYVNRLTPSRYPAKLTRLRFYMPAFEGRPEPIGKTIRVVVFRDPAGGERPPDDVAFDVDREFRIPDYGRFLELDVDGPVIESGDVYVGYQAPNPHDGVGFAVDLDGAPGLRSFRSTDGGKTFSGPIEVTFQGRTGPANLMLRAIVKYDAPEDPGEPPSFRLEADPREVDLSEGDDTEAKVELLVAAIGDFEGEVELTAATDPKGVPVQVELSAEKVKAGESVELKLSRLEQVEEDLFHVVVTATSGRDGERPARLAIPVFRWRVIAQALIGADGGSLAGGGIEVALAPGALRDATSLRLLAGRPQTGFEGQMEGPAYRLEGLPDEVSGEIRLSFRQPPKAALRAAEADAAPVAAVTLQQVGGDGKTQSATRLLPAAGNTVVLRPVEFKLVRRISTWMLKGYYVGDTPQGHFRIFYPIGYSEAATRIGEWLEEAFNRLIAEVGLKNLEQDLAAYLRWSLPGVDIGWGGYPIQVTLKKLDDTLHGVADRSTLSFNIVKLGSAEAIEAFRPVPAHEFMHLVQSVHGGVSPWTATKTFGYPWLWMDEAISTWFEPIGIGQPDYIPSTVRPNAGQQTNQSDNYRTFPARGLLQVPLYAKDQQEHGYGAALFLTDLSRRHPNLIRDLLAKRDPAQAPVETLAAVLGGPARLAEEWSRFAGNYLHGDIYPGVHFPKLFDLLPNKSEFKWQAFSRSSSDSWKRFYWANEDLSLETFYVSFLTVKELPELTDGVYLAATLDALTDEVDLHAFAFDRDSWESLGVAQRGQPLLFPEAGVLARERRGVLLVVVRRGASMSRDPNALNVLVDLAPPEAKIRGPIGITGVIGMSYEFSTRNRNIEKDAEYLWNFAGTTKTGRSVQHAFTTAGDHLVELTVVSGKHRITDRAIVKIAPDTAPPEKAEVLFDVYRRVRVAALGGSWSNQKCNSYKISILDAKNQVIETGESIARNGAYDTKLPVADGYSYVVDYTYTTMCRDSGRRTGKFDVKRNQVNYVPVETPPCEQ